MAEQRHGELVVVTGAGSGIGRALALALAGEGARVAALERDAVRLKAVVEELQRHGEGHGFEVDVTDAEAMERVAGEIEGRLGTVELLFNNAGIGIFGDFLETSLEQWHRILAINVMGVVHGCRAFGRAMLERGRGHIVNIASGVAFAPPPYLSAYSTTKGAVLALSLSLRHELAPRGVAVTAVCPGIIDTDITRATERVGRARDESIGEKTRALYRRRGYGPERAARAILKGLRRRPAVLPVAPEAWLSWYWSRMLPGSDLLQKRFVRSILGREAV